MKKAAFIISVLTMLLVQSCTNQDLGSADSATKLEVSNSMYIERDPSSITSSDANKVAALFHGGSPTSTRSSVNNEVTEIKDSITGEPLLYIVNYGGNKGFVLISASKNTLLFLPTRTLDISSYRTTLLPPSSLGTTRRASERHNNAHLILSD